MEELAEALRARGPTPALIQTYQVLDDDITRAMRAAAKLAGRKDFGYQRSDVLVITGRRVRLMKTIASCVRNKMGYSDKVRPSRNAGLRPPRLKAVFEKSSTYELEFVI